MVHPTKDGTLIHGSPILPCYMKVSLDLVYDKYLDLKLPLPVDEEIETLGQASGSFIQWHVPCMCVIKKTVTAPNQTVTRPYCVSERNMKVNNMLLIFCCLNFVVTAEFVVIAKI